MKQIFFFFSFFALLFFAFASTSNHAYAAVDSKHPGYRVEGRFLYDNQGEKVILYGVNKMIIWMDKDGDPSFSEIAKTGANCVRIVWNTEGSAEDLDTAIYNCRKEHMIPMVELHDATGEWSKLPNLVKYWVREDIVKVIKKHQEYLLINIGNEVGNEVTETAFKTDYKKFVIQMRNAGIHVPLFIDACNWGQNIDILQSCGPEILKADPDKNLMFSVHMWWPYMYGYTDQRVVDELAETAAMNLPLIVGEFGHQWDETAQGKIPYKVIIEHCYKNQIGYLAWEWGPGNNPQTFLDMTTDSTFETLRDWGLEVALTNKYSIQNIAERPASMLSALPAAKPAEPLPEGNLALNQPVTASSSDSLYPAANIVDGDRTTRWASEISDPNWVSVDLGERKEIDRVIIQWEAAYATQYKIQVSNDAKTWTDVDTQYNGKGNTEDISLTAASGRYVRIYGSQRYNQSWPYSIFEIGIYGPESNKSASISPSVAVFDKNTAKQTDVTVTLDSKNNLCTAVKNGSTLLKADTDYTIDKTTLTVKKEYLSQQAKGTIKLTLDYSHGVDPVLFIAIGDTSPSAYIRPGRVLFNKSGEAQEDIAIAMTANGNALKGIFNGTTALVSEKDYTISGNTIILKKTYLAKLPLNITKLTFDFEKGSDPLLKVDIIDTTPNAVVSPVTTSFEKRLPKDISIAMTPNGNTLTAIRNGSAALIKGTDYTVNKDVVILSKDYLAAQSIGITKLTFDFSAGNDPVLSIHVTDTAPNATIAPGKAAFDKASPKDIQITMTPNGNTLKAIRNGSAILTADTDYMITGNVVTIKKEYLSRQSSDLISLTFDFSEGVDPVLLLNPPAPEAIPVVKVKTTGNSNSVSQNYTITAQGGTIDLSKISILFTADGMSTAAQTVYIDNAALQCDAAPYYTSINSSVKGTISDGKLTLSIDGTELADGAGSLSIDLRFAKTDWSSYGTLSNPVVSVYYDGIRVQ